MTLNEALSTSLLLEDIPLVKFYYKNWKNDKYPEVMAFDTEYPGREGQKSYGERKDLLGWNLNYYKNKKEASDSINDINDFADLLSKNKEEKYKRIKYFFPEQSSLLRRYKKNSIKFLRVKDKDGLWKRKEENI
jgi:hypothetical protein